MTFADCRLNLPNIRFRILNISYFKPAINYLLYRSVFYEIILHYHFYIRYLILLSCYIISMKEMFTKANILYIVIYFYFFITAQIFVHNAEYTLTWTHSQTYICIFVHNSMTLGLVQSIIYRQQAAYVRMAPWCRSGRECTTLNVFELYIICNGMMLLLLYLSFYMHIYIYMN